MSDPVKVIARRLQRLCAPFAVASIRDSRSTDWRSLLFDGARHRIELGIDGERIDEALEAIYATVDAADFAICGHLIAEIRVSGTERRDGHALVTLNALTVEG